MVRYVAILLVYVLCTCYRVQAYIRNDWSTNIVDPDHDTVGEGSLSSEVDIESGLWKPLKEAFSATFIIFKCLNYRLLYEESC